jgi:hypothetical protein
MRGHHHATHATFQRHGVMIDVGAAWHEILCGENGHCRPPTKENGNLSGYAVSTIVHGRHSKGMGARSLWLFHWEGASLVRPILDKR